MNRRMAAMCGAITAVVIAVVVLAVYSFAQAPVHATDITWNAVSGAAGYNVYKSVTTTDCVTLAGQTKINQSPVNVIPPAYTDLNVQLGKSYCYTVRTIGPLGDESGDSVAVLATFPPGPTAPGGVKATTR